MGAMEVDVVERAMAVQIWLELAARWAVWL